jgi:hypothetical protein
MRVFEDEQKAKKKQEKNLLIIAKNAGQENMTIVEYPFALKKILC